MKVVLFNFCCLIILLSCQNEVQNLSKRTNDTTEVLKLSIKEAISDYYMPSASALKQKHQFEDSILLTSTSISLDILPSRVDTQDFKIMSQIQICAIATEETKFELANYLCIARFERNDTGYYVQVKNLNCFPYGSGGSLGLYLKKEENSFKVVQRSSSSIN